MNGERNSAIFDNLCQHSPHRPVLLGVGEGEREGEGGGGGGGEGGDNEPITKAVCC